MTLEYRCSNCGTLLQTTNADAIDLEISDLRHEILLLRGALKTIQRTASGIASPMLEHINEVVAGVMPLGELTK